MHPQVPCVTQKRSKELDLQKWLETWCRSQLPALKGVEGSCWKLRIRLGRDQAIWSQTCIQNQHKLVKTHSACIWCWDKPRANSDSHDTSRPWLGRCHHHTPLYYSLRSPTGVASEWLFFPGLPKWNPGTIPVWTPGTLGLHSSSSQPPIGTRSKPNL
jgi:hypothetical protein